MLPSEINHAKTWKYAQPEWERRFVLAKPPNGWELLPKKTITDLYVTGARFRLRKTVSRERIQFKLTKKLSLGKQEWVSTIYLSEAEYELLSQLPGDSLQKVRYQYSPPEGPVVGLDLISIDAKTIWLAEVELTEVSYQAYQFPLPFAHEVSQDPTYSGREIARTFQL